MIGFYTIRRCTIDLHVVEVKRAFTRKRAMQILDQNAEKYGQGSFVYFFWKLYAIRGPLGHQGPITSGIIRRDKKAR